MRSAFRVVSTLLVLHVSSSTASFLGAPRGPTSRHHTIAEQSHGDVANGLANNVLSHADTSRPTYRKEAMARQRKMLGPRIVGWLRASVGAAAFSLSVKAPRLVHRAWRLLPHRLPDWWVSACAISDDFWERALFLLSNVSYLYGAIALWTTSSAPPLLGSLMLACCGVSTLYHTAQCTDGVASAKAARWLYVDVALANLSVVAFALHCHPSPLSLALGALSLAFFVDAPQLGYTASHSLWHIFSAASGVSLAYSVRSAARGTHGIRA